MTTAKKANRHPFCPKCGKELYSKLNQRGLMCRKHGIVKAVWKK